MLNLSGHWRDMPLMSKCFFLRRWTLSYTATPAVETHAAGVVNRHPFVVDVVNLRDVYVVDCRVVVEMIVVPTSAVVATSEISETIVNSAIEPDSQSPIATVENVSSVAPTPVRRRPQVPHFGRQHPRSRHPVITATIVGPSPVAGGPNITVAGTNGLIVNRNFRRRDSDRHSDLCETRRGHEQHRHGQQHCTNKAHTHQFSSRGGFAAGGT